MSGPNPTARLDDDDRERLGEVLDLLAERFNIPTRNSRAARRHEHLKAVLRGAHPDQPSGPLYWDGTSDKATVTYASIRNQRKGSIPPRPPSSDWPPEKTT